MRYLSTSDEEQKEILQSLGLDSIEDLLKSIPSGIRVQGSLELPEALTEPELIQYFHEIEKKNVTSRVSFLGAGVNQHLIPLVISSLISRGEFLTSYTPYQAEISQGTLQAIFEYQTFICQLTGMEISNASMYDGSSALAEATLMASRISKKKRFLIAKSIHPEYREVIKTYTRYQDFVLDEIGFYSNGSLNLENLKKEMNENVAAVIIQSPNFFGNLESLKSLSEICRSNGVLMIVNIAELLSLGIVKPPGIFGADIVCGEAQSLGVPQSFGGPHIGFLATRERFLRNLPGRLVGQTIDKKGRRGFVLTLSTREQHIRREKATSNICTNQNLTALMVTIYCSLIGKNGIREIAMQNLSKTQYATNALLSNGVNILFNGPRFNEFVIRPKCSIKELLKRCDEVDLIPGLPLQHYYPEMQNTLLISITETKSKKQIDKLVRCFSN